MYRLKHTKHQSVAPQQCQAGDLHSIPASGSTGWCHHGSHVVIGHMRRKPDNRPALGTCDTCNCVEITFLEITHRRAPSGQGPIGDKRHHMTCPTVPHRLHRLHSFRASTSGAQAKGLGSQWLSILTQPPSKSSCTWRCTSMHMPWRLRESRAPLSAGQRLQLKRIMCTTATKKGISKSPIPTKGLADSSKHKWA
jgi:hypothetical protein